MSQQRLRARLSTLALKRRARRAPAVYCAVGGGLGLLLAHDAGANAWLIATALGLAGLGFGRVRAAACREQARRTFAWSMACPASAIRARAVSLATSSALRRGLRATFSEPLAAVDQSGVRALYLPAELLSVRTAAS
jgi:hypothetical protein